MKPKENNLSVDPLPLQETKIWATLASHWWTCVPKELVDQCVFVERQRESVKI
jgi:hypothetical protein